jgi:hypothetical protein
MAQLAHAKEFEVTSTPKMLYSATDLCRSITTRYLFLGIVVVASTSWAQTRAPILERIAKTYGLDSFGQVEAIRYTWNAEIPGLFKVSHAWEWEPKTNKIVYEGKEKNGKPVKVTYMASEPSSQSDIEERSRALFRQRQLLASVPFPRVLGYQRHGNR